MAPLLLDSDGDEDEEEEDDEVDEEDEVADEEDEDEDEDEEEEEDEDADDDDNDDDDESLPVTLPLTAAKPSHEVNVESMTTTFVADYSDSDAGYASTNVVSGTLPPVHDLRRRIVQRRVFLSVPEVLGVKLLEPIGAYAKAASDCALDVRSAVQLVPADAETATRIGDESEVDRELLVELRELRAQFCGAERKAQLSAWYATSPLDGVGKFQFNFASAVALASLDAVLHLTTPLAEFAHDNDFLHFADLCGGPGGFSEYVMHRRQTHGAKGWGMTLRGDSDFQLHNFCSTAPHSNFVTHYGADDSGDITLLANADSFIELVTAQTKGKMLALVLADGTAENGDRLLLSQLYVALAVVRNHGCLLLRVTTPHGNVPSLAAAVLSDCSASICLTRAPAACADAHLTDGAYLYARNVDEAGARAASAAIRQLLEQLSAAPGTRLRFAGGVSPLSSSLAAYLKAHRLFVATTSACALRRAIDALVIVRGGGAVAAELARATATGDMAAARTALQERIARDWSLPLLAPAAAAAVASVGIPPTLAAKPPIPSRPVAPVALVEPRKSVVGSVYNSSWQGQSASTASTGAAVAVNLSSYLAPSQVTAATAAKRPASAMATPAASAGTGAAKRPATTAGAAATPTAATDVPKVVKLKQPADAAAAAAGTSEKSRFANIDLSKYKSKIVK